MLPIGASGWRIYGGSWTILAIFLQVLNYIKMLSQKVISWMNGGQKDNHS